MRVVTKKTFWTFNLLCTLSGIGFFLTQTFLEQETVFGQEKHFSEKWWQAAHIYLGAMFLISLGMITSDHLLPKLKSKSINRKKSGIAMATLFSVCIFSGYAIMVVASKEIVEVLSWVHLISGLLVFGIFLFHTRFFRSK